MQAWHRDSVPQRVTQMGASMGVRDVCSSYPGEKCEGEGPVSVNTAEMGMITKPGDASHGAPHPILHVPCG